MRKSKFINLMDKMLETNKSEYFKTVDYSVKAKLSPIGKLKEKIINDCNELTRLYETSFDYEMNKGKFSKLEPKNQRTHKKEIDLMISISTNLEFFFYSIISFFDVLAKYTKFMYNEGKGKDIKTYTFSKQIKWFGKNVSVDKDYFKLLKNLTWFNFLENKRDRVIHNISPIVIPERKYSLFRLMFSLKFSESDIIDVEAYVKRIVINTYKFLESYGSHFTKKLDNNS